jgi:glutamine synthetase
MRREEAVNENAIEAVRKRIAERNIEEVDIRFCDLLGFWRHVTLPAALCDADLFKRGVGFDGSTLDGMTATEAGDLCLVPDPRRIFFDPFMKKPTAALIGDIIHPDSGRPFSRDPRGVARKAAELARFEGVATETHWAPEFEFYLFDKASFWLRGDSAGYSFEHIEMPSSAEHPQNLGLVHGTHSAYHMMPPLDSMHDLRAEMAAHMTAAGIPVKYHHHEVGRFGQCEIETTFMPMVSAADTVMITKYIVRNTALRGNMASTFMAKPVPGQPGSGMHFHIYFEKNGERIFFDRDGYCCLSATARSAIAGILHHAPALCVFTNPSVNSYHRLVPAQEAPVFRFFSGPNRSSAIRVPAYARTPQKMRFEYRVPDGTSNPYLCTAAILMAALDGIRQGMIPEEMGFGPLDDNVFAPGYDTAGLHRLPENLGRALDALEDDRQFLEENGVFEPDLIDNLIKVKRAELGLFRGNPHPMEHMLYFSL